MNLPSQHLSHHPLLLPRETFKFDAIPYNDIALLDLNLSTLLRILPSSQIRINVLEPMSGHANSLDREFLVVEVLECNFTFEAGQSLEKGEFDLVCDVLFLVGGS